MLKNGKTSRKFHGRMIASALSLFLLGGSLLPSVTQASESVFFTAANDSVLPLEDSSMPVWIDGQLYVPYTVFDANSTGINIGTQSTRNTAAGTITVYNLAHTLMFDLNEGHSVDQRSNLVYPYKAVLRQGIPFLPVAGVCNFFGLTYSYQNTNYGYLLRLKGNNVVLSDSRFIDAADSLLSSMLKDYQQVDMPAPQPEEAAPEPEPPPVPEEPEEEMIPTPYILGIHLSDHNVALPQALGQEGLKAVFFFTPEQLETEGNTLRFLLGEGHQIGLKITGQSEEDVLEQINYGNALLVQQARCTTQLISTSSGWHPTLEALSYIPWKGGDPLSLSDGSVALVSNLPQGPQTQYLTLEQNEDTLAAFPSLYRALTQKQFVSLSPRDTHL